MFISEAGLLDLRSSYNNSWKRSRSSGWHSCWFCQRSPILDCDWKSQQRLFYRNEWLQWRQEKNHHLERRWHKFNQSPCHWSFQGVKYLFYFFHNKQKGTTVRSENMLVCNGNDGTDFKGAVLWPLEIPCVTFSALRMLFIRGFFEPRTCTLFQWCPLITLLHIDCYDANSPIVPDLLFDGFNFCF